MNIKEMREYLGNDGKPISRADFSKIYNVPCRTLQDWELGKRKPPEYVLQLLEKDILRSKENK